MITIPNTTITRLVNGGYRITPNEGFVLHDTILDFYENFDDEGNPVGEPIMGYRPVGSSCGANYDFTVTTVIDGYTAYGNRKFFARPQSEVPENQIFTVGEPDHEVM